MSTAEIWNIILLFVQAMILLGQLHLSRQIHNGDNAKEKGYFIIEETNYKHPDKKHFVNEFVLSQNTGISFCTTGKADVYLCGSRITVEGKIVKEHKTPYDAMFTLNDRFNKCTMYIPLTKAQLNEDKVGIVIEFYIKNSCNYKYTETISMQFENEHSRDVISFWKLCKYNMIFKKGHVYIKES